MNTDACVPKLTGADVELGNFVEGVAEPADSVGEASKALLDEIRRAVGHDPTDVEGERASAEDPQDSARTFLPTNGGCAYIDLDHLELCIPEVLSAYDHVSYWQAMLRLASDAQASINARRPAGGRVQVLANNTDGRVSYGSHLNVLVSRNAWNEVVHRKPHYLAWLAAFQVSSLPLTGQGKVGSVHRTSSVAYQLSQRADYFETMTGVQTTFMRPLVNTRDEPLCGRWLAGHGQRARLHCIFYDTTLCHVSTLLRVGTMQIVLAMIEAGEVDCRIALDDPLTAVRQWSHDPTLTTKARLVSGESVTAIELQRRFLDQAAMFVDRGGTDDIVPRAREIVALWEDTLLQLDAQNWESLARRLDWVLKLSFLERVFQHRPKLRWDSPEIRHLDQLYSSLDHAEGLFWSVADRGLIDIICSEREIARCVTEPPHDTRAWGRAMLQRRAGSAVEQVDWDHVRVRLADRHGGSTTWRVDLPDPLRANAAEYRALTETNGSVQDLLYALGATREPRVEHNPDAGTNGAVDWAFVLNQWRQGGIRNAQATSGMKTLSYGGGNDATA